MKFYGIKRLTWENIADPLYIFIDESGTFSGIGNPEPSVSTLGALIICSYKMPKLYKAYGKLRETLPKKGGEVKGSLLNEEQCSAVLAMLRQHEAIFCSSMIDMADHSLADVERHRTSGIAALARNLTNGHTPELRANVSSLQMRMKNFPPQLYAQMIVTIDLLHRVMEEMIGYHSQRNPKELSSFHWVIDAKQKGLISDWEDWWSNMIVVWLQAVSIKRPGMLLKVGDYRHFERFFMNEVPEYLSEVVPPASDKRATGVDLQKMFREHFTFSSEALPGLELVDIATNCLRRALVGNLEERGWLGLRSLMINRSDCTVRPVALHFDDRTVSKRYSRVLQVLSEGERSMFTRHSSERG
ncbi:MAG: hypothetical protein V7651_03470 [Hyphomonas oceanitis]|uniref:hypothetical protein n=1 Tax=Hyphomonas oceanitis TaxID=81033 RepID=UPI003002C317